MARAMARAGLAQATPAQATPPSNDTPRPSRHTAPDGIPAPESYPLGLVTRFLGDAAADLERALREGVVRYESHGKRTALVEAEG